MLNWFDLMRQAQGGAGLENLARQFNLSAQQTSAALAALMPAYAMGLQHAAADPGGMARIMQSLMQGPYAAFFENATQAFSPQAKREGEQFLDQLFGSDEVSRRVARQAATFSGVGVDVLQQMLPLVAGIVAGGLAKMAQSQGAAVKEAVQTLQGQAAAPQGAAGAAPWLDLWSQWAGLMQAAGSRPEPVPEAAQATPFEDMMSAFLRPGAAPRTPEPEPAPEPPPQAPPPEPNPFQAWGEMMERGHEVQRQHLANLQSIFEGVWKSGKG